jgi:hypothetical protein
METELKEVAWLKQEGTNLFKHMFIYINPDTDLPDDLDGLRIFNNENAEPIKYRVIHNPTFLTLPTSSIKTTLLRFYGIIPTSLDPHLRWRLAEYERTGTD